MAAPRSVGPAVFLGSPPTHNTLLVPPGVYGSWPLLAVWDPRFSRAHRQPSTHFGPSWSVRRQGRSSQCGTRGFPGLTANPQHSWSFLECAAPGRSSQCGKRGLLGLTANPQHTLVPPGVCGSMTAPRSPAVCSGSPPTHNTLWSLLECAAPGRSSQCGTRGFLSAKLIEKKKQKLENSTQLQQERAHTRFNEYTLTRPQCIVHT